MVSIARVYGPVVATKLDKFKNLHAEVRSGNVTHGWFGPSQLEPARSSSPAGSRSDDIAKAEVEGLRLVGL